MWLFDFQKKEFQERIGDILDGNYLFDSTYTDLFEKEFAKQFNFKSTVAMPSGTAAIEAALFALDSKVVAIPAMTAREVEYATKRIAKKIVYYDTSKMYPVAGQTEIKQMLKENPDVDTIVYVHTAGISLLDEIDIPDGIKVLEDCSHAHGIKEYGHKGDIAIYSYFTTKVLSGGTGIIASDNTELVEIARKYARREIPEHGYTFHTHEFPALLSYLDTRYWRRIVAERRIQASLYHENDIYSLQDVFRDEKGIEPTYYKFTVKYRPLSDIKQDLFLTGYTHDFTLKSLPNSVWWTQNHLNLLISRKLDENLNEVKILKNCSMIKGGR